MLRRESVRVHVSLGEAAPQATTIPSRWIPSRRLPSLRLLLRPRLCRWGLRRLSTGVPVLRLSLRRVPDLRGPGLPGPRLRTGAGLPAADATLRGALKPNPSLLHRRLLLLARRWSDGRLLLGMGAGCAGSAPGALSTAEPLGGTMGAAT